MIAAAVPGQLKLRKSAYSTYGTMSNEFSNSETMESVFMTLSLLK